MARFNPALQTFNRGRISKLALARTDLDRTRLSAERQTNFVPRTLGSMMLRPGLQYLGNPLGNNTAVLVPFVYSATDTALLEFTTTSMRVWVDDDVLQRPASTAAVTLSSFSSTNLGGWTDADDGGATSEWFTGNFLSLVGTRFAWARRRQTVTSSSGTHGLQVVVHRGRPVLKVGSSDEGDDYFPETTLRPGVYSLAITSTGNFVIEFAGNTEYRSLVTSCAVEASGTVMLDSTFAEADLKNIRWDQSADVVFAACSSYQQKRIERHSTSSWALVNYEPEDGPFRNPNTSNKRLTPSGRTGDITLSCDQPFFKATHGGALMQITSVGQDVSVTPSGDDQFSNHIRVSGVDDARKFRVHITATSTYDVELRVQRSPGEPGTWSDVSELVFTTTTDSTHDDGLDNQIIYYRIGTNSTGYVSGSPTAALEYEAGGVTGVVRVHTVFSATESSASVLSELGSTNATETWREGEWSERRGFPTAVAFHEGRIWYAGKSKLWGSVSDAFESHDPDIEGDSRAVNRSIGTGPVDRVQWLVSLGRLIIGTDDRELQAKTGSLEEPLTPSNFSLRDISTQGSAPAQAVKVDKRALFVQQGGVRVMETGYSGDSLDLETAERTILVPEIGEPSITRMAVQRQPDTRVHGVRGSGTVALLVSDPAENVLAWVDVETGDADGVNGVIEEVAVLPGAVEDNVYYVVKREINGSTVRFLEKWAQEGQARGGSSNRMADAFEVYNSSDSTAVITGADHLHNASVVVWASTSSSAGREVGTYTVSTSGVITTTSCSTTLVYGLPYSGTFESGKLAYAAQQGSALTQRKRISHLGLVLADAHAQGLQYGTSTGNLSNLPLVEKGAVVSSDEVHTSYDNESFSFPGEWNTDSRLVLQARAPRPVTVLGALVAMETKEKP